MLAVLVAQILIAAPPVGCLTPECMAKETRDSAEERAAMQRKLAQPNRNQGVPANEIKDCNYWNDRIAEARRCATENTSKGRGQPSSMKSSYGQAAQLCREAIPKYEREAQSCRARQSPRQPRADVEAAPGSVSSANVAYQALQQVAEELRGRGQAEAAGAIDRLRQEYEGHRYSGSGSSAQAVEKAKSLLAQNTDELVPDRTDTWDVPPARTRASGGRHGNEPIDGRGLPDVIDFRPGDSSASCAEEWVVCLGEPASPPPPAEPDYAELGYTDRATLAKELAEALIDDRPGPEGATSVFGVPLEEGRTDQPESYPNDDFDPELAAVEAVAKDAARGTLRERLPDDVQATLDAADDPTSAFEKWTESEADRHGVRAQVDKAYDIAERGMECFEKGDDRLCPNSPEGILRDLPIFSQLYALNDELEDSASTASTIVRGVFTAARDLAQVGEKSLDLGVAVGQLAKAKFGKMIGMKCIRRSQEGGLTCAW